MKLKKRNFIFSAATLAAALAVTGAFKGQTISGTNAEMPAALPGSPQTIRVGIVQMNARVLDKRYNLRQAEELIRDAAAQGAKIVLTPESAVQGYPRVDLHPGESTDAPAIVEGRKRILAAAETIPGPSTLHFSRLAQKLGIWIVFGMEENRNGQLFNTAVLMNPQGRIVGTYSKVHLQNWMTASGVLACAACAGNTMAPSSIAAASPARIGFRMRVMMVLLSAYVVIGLYRTAAAVISASPTSRRRRRCTC